MLLQQQQPNNLPLGGSAPRARTNLTGTPQRRAGFSDPRRLFNRSSSDGSKSSSISRSVLFASDDDVKKYVTAAQPCGNPYGMVHVITACTVLAGIFFGSYYTTRYKTMFAEIQTIQGQTKKLSEQLIQARRQLSETESRTRLFEEERNQIALQYQYLETGNYKGLDKLKSDGPRLSNIEVNAYGGISGYQTPTVVHGSTHFYIDSSKLPESERNKREKAQMFRAAKLKERIQEISKRELLDRFGQGPHRVEFELAFFDHAEANVLSNKFVVEMASSDLMPHSVLLFLEMIQHKLWDNTAIVHNKDHVVTASPTNFYTGESKNAEFDEAGLSRVSFQEYHEHFPHEKYTLGFAGRPGGPDFYISVEDNIEKHGPGGFEDSDIKEEADPCFARVVQGFDTVDRIYERGVDSELGVNIVGIVQARILSNREFNKNNIDGMTSR